MAYTCSLLHSASSTKEILIGKFIENEGEILAVKGKTIEVFSIEDGELFSVNEEIGTHFIEFADKLREPAGDLLVYSAEGVLYAACFDSESSRFKQVCSKLINSEAGELADLKVYGQFVFISRFVDQISVVEFGDGNFSEELTYSVLGTIIDFALIGELLIVLCFCYSEGEGRVLWKVYETQSLIQELVYTYYHAESGFPYKLIHSTGQLYVVDDSNSLVYIQLNSNRIVDQVIVGSLTELCSSWCFSNDKLLIGGDKGTIFAVSNRSISSVLTTKSDPLIKIAGNHLVVFNRNNDYCVYALDTFQCIGNLERNWAVTDALFVPWGNPDVEGQLLVSCSNFESSKIEWAYPAIPVSTAAILQDAGQRCLQVFKIDSYLFLSYPETVRVVCLETYESVPIQELSLYEEKTLLIGKFEGKLFQVTDRNLISGDGRCLKFEGNTVLAACKEEYVFLYGSTDSLICIRNFEIAWKKIIEDVCCLVALNRVYCGLSNGTILGFDYEGNEVYKIVLGELEIVPNSIILYMNYLVVGDRRGRIVFLVESTISFQRELGTLPITFAVLEDKLLLVSNNAYVIQGKDLRYQLIDLGKSRMIHQLSDNKFLSIADDISIHSLEVPYSYSLNFKTIISEQGVIKRIGFKDNKIFYINQGALKIFDIFTKEQLNIYPVSPNLDCVTLLPDSDYIIAYGELDSSSQGQAVLLTTDLREIWKGTFFYRVTACCSLANHLAVAAENWILFLTMTEDGTFPELCRHRVRETVVALHAEGTVLFVTDPHDGIVIYNLNTETKSLEYLRLIKEGYGSPISSLIGSKIYLIDITGLFTVYDKEIGSLKYSHQLTEGGRCLVLGDLKNYINPRAKQSEIIFVLTLSGSIYEISID